MCLRQMSGRAAGLRFKLKCINIYTVRHLVPFHESSPTSRNAVVKLTNHQMEVKNWNAFPADADSGHENVQNTQQDSARSDLTHDIGGEHSSVPTHQQTARPRSGWRFGPEDEEGAYVLLPLSAKSEGSLKDLAAKWLDFKEDKDAFSVASWAATRRRHHPTRLAVVTNSGTRTRECLQSYINNTAPVDVITGTAQTSRPKVCFVFPGQGQQWQDMGRKLYQREPIFRETINACDTIFRSISGWSLLKKSGLFSEIKDTPEMPLRVSQPATLFIQIGLHILLKHWGISPDVVIGQSLGEIAAAFACGGLNLEEAIRVMYNRCTEQEKQEGTGRMAAVRASVAEAEQLVAGFPGVQVACENSPTSVTIAGTTEVIEALAEDNPAKVKVCRVSCAYHTDHMDPIKESFLSKMSSLDPEGDGNGPVPYYSSVTGDRYSGKFDGSYWWDTIRESVKFASATKSVIRDHNPDIYVELSASIILLSSVAQTLEHHGSPMKVTVPCGQRQQNDRRCLLRALGTLYVNGVDINWTNVTQAAAVWAPIPTYAW